jgi:glycosyltransferase involved in cell wall biosynthesis
VNPALHIGLVGPLPPPAGGMANQTRQLAELLRGEGLDVSIVQTNAAYRPDWIASIPVARALFRLIPYLFALWKLAGRCDLIHIMANSGWSWHLFAAPAIWIAKLRNRPSVVNYHGGEAENFLKKSSDTISRSLRHSAALIVPSAFLEAVFSRFGLAAKVVPNTIDTGRFSNAEPQRTVRRQLLVSRNLEPIYDNETAIRAFAIVQQAFPDATLTIAGSGPQASQLAQLVADLGLNACVRFTGRLDRDEMANAYREADISINPSLVDNMPISILEAMASGTPIVSTQVGGVPFVVEDGKTALLVPPGSPEAMAAAICKLMDDQALANLLVTNGLQEVQKYTWQKTWPLLANVYLSACSMQPDAR